MKAKTWIKYEEKRPEIGQIIELRDKRVFSVQTAGPSNAYLTNFATGMNEYVRIVDGLSEYTVIDKQVAVKGLIKKSKDAADTIRTLSGMYRGITPSNTGCDPELFLTQDGKLAPAFDLLPLGNKVKTPRNIFADGFAAEINPSAGGCLAYLSDRTHDLIELLYKDAKAKKLELSAQNVFEVPQDIMGRCTDAQVELGCDPTFNVYGLRPYLSVPRNMLLRSAGGHMHFDMRNFGNGLHIGDFNKGFAEPTPGQVTILERCVRALDMTIGVMSVSMFEKFDDPRRRFHYGQAGEYRIPMWGLEYRTLSNAWIRHPVLMHMCFDLARSALNLGLYDCLFLLDTTEQEVVQIIQDCDVKTARKYMKRNEIALKSVMYSTHLASGAGLDKAFEKFYEGAHTFIKDPDDIAKNWKIGVDGAHWSGHAGAPNCCWSLNSTQQNIENGVMI